MTDFLTNVFFFRGVERWIIVFGGIGFAYLGYKLFLYGVDEGHGKLETESQFFKLTFSGSGPGLFFMAFGAIVLVNAIYADAKHTREMVNAAGADVAPKTAGVLFAKETTSFSGRNKRSVCDLLSDNQGNVRDILWTYDNRIESEKMKSLAKSIETNVQDESIRRELLVAVEEVICELE